jgi:hypothetical protein
MRDTNASSGLWLLIYGRATLRTHAFTTTASCAQLQWQQRTASACTVCAGKCKSGSDEELQFYDPEPEPEPAGTPAPSTAAVCPIFGERRDAESNTNVENELSLLLQESYGLEDIDFDELEFELDTNCYTDNSSS